MSHLHKLPKITKEVEKDVETLFNLYEYEENQALPSVCEDTWNRALTIYNTFECEKPYYIVFMVKQVSSKLQTFACKFMICTAKSDGSMLKDCLVWYCHKKKGIFKLATELCDLRPKREHELVHD